MKLNSAPLITLLCCTTFAAMDFDARLFSVRFEALSSAPNIYWYYIQPFSRGEHASQTVAPVIQSQQVSRVMPYQEKYDDPVFNYSGRVLFDVPVTEHIDIGVYFGVESSLQSGKTLAVNDQSFDGASRQLCDNVSNNAGANVKLFVPDHERYPTVSSKIVDQMHFVPGVHVLYDGFGVGIQYDLREYRTSGHMIPDDIKRHIHEDSILFGIRAQKDFHVGRFCFDVFGEGYSNFKERSRSEMSDYWLTVGRGMENTSVDVPQDSPPIGTITSILKVSAGVSLRLLDY